MRKQTFCTCENKDADQRLCFRYIDSTNPYFLNPEFIFCSCTVWKPERLFSHDAAHFAFQELLYLYWDLSPRSDNPWTYIVSYLNPLVTNELSHPYQMGESTFFRGFISISCFDENPVRQNSPAFCGVTSEAILFAYVP